MYTLGSYIEKQKKETTTMTEQLSTNGHENKHNQNSVEVSYQREKGPASQTELDEVSYSDILDAIGTIDLTQEELNAIAGGKLEEMLLDVSDKKANGEIVPRGVEGELKDALQFINGIEPKWDDERSSIGKISDEIDQCKKKISLLGNQAALQKNRIEQKIRGLTLAYDLMSAIVKKFNSDEREEWTSTVKKTGKDLTDHQMAIIAGDLINKRIVNHNKRMKRNAERRAATSTELVEEEL